MLCIPAPSMAKTDCFNHKSENKVRDLPMHFITHIHTCTRIVCVCVWGSGPRWQKPITVEKAIVRTCVAQGVSTGRKNTAVQYIKFTLCPTANPCSVPFSWKPLHYLTLPLSFCLSISPCNSTNTLTPWGIQSQITLQHCVKLNSINYTYLTTRMCLGIQPEGLCVLVCVCVYMSVWLCFAHRSIVPLGSAYFTQILFYSSPIYFFLLSFIF